MFTRFLTKGLKNISIDSKKSHIFLKDTDISLVIMRPLDLVQLGDLVGSGSEDILVWTGKTIGKALCTSLQKNSKIKTRKKMFEALLNNLTSMGYGKFKMNYNEGKFVKIQINNSIVDEIGEDSDAELIRNLYTGIFLGSFSTAGAEIEERKTKQLKKVSPLEFEFAFVEDEI